MRRAVLPALLVLLGLLAVPAAADRPQRLTAGQQVGTFDTATGPALRYYLYVPTAVADKPHRKVPLYVYLHGCNQRVKDDVDVGSRLQLLAEQEGLLVLFPEQNRPAGSTYPAADGNGSACWNWFHPDHQGRDAGEPATIAGLTRDVMQRFAVDERRVWLAGISAGAAMANVMGATYPELYRAVAPIVGCAYRTCSDADGSAAHAAMGTRARVVPTLVVQNSIDMVNNDVMGSTSVGQWVGANDLADNGAADGSVSRVPSSTASYPAVQGAAPGQPCVGNSRLPCIGGAAGLKSYPYTVSRFDGADGASVVELVVVHGANHAYTGGDPRGTFVDPTGPGIPELTYDFFTRHTR